jgi:hypothetical protein
MDWKDFELLAKKFSQVVVLVSAAVVTTYTGYRTFTQSAEVRDTRQAISLAEISEALARAERAERDAEGLKKAIEAAKPTIAGPSISAKLAQVEATQGNLQQRLKGLEDALVATPVTALAVPLLRKDLDATRERVQADELATKEREQRSGDTQKWIFGLVAALITGIAAQWFGNRFRKTAG